MQNQDRLTSITKTHPSPPENSATPQPNSPDLVAACRVCQSPIRYTDPEGLFGRFGIKPTICNPCEDKRLVDAEAARKVKLLEQWESFCPRLYQDTNILHEGMPVKAIVHRVLQWPYQTKGLFLRGPSGTGKTRLCWLLLRRLMMEGRTVVALTSGRFAAEAAAVQMLGGQEPSNWFKCLTSVDVLFLDDLGKFKLTERVEADLFEIIEARAANCLPLLITSNLNGDTLESMLSPDRGSPIIRRLGEFCEDVAL